MTTERAAARVTRPDDAFEFGRNWQRYISTYLDEERLQIAAESLHGLVGDVDGKTFLDIGAGSGLFSLCAHEAGAARVVSIDEFHIPLNVVPGVTVKSIDPLAWP